MQQCVGRSTHAGSPVRVRRAGRQFSANVKQRSTVHSGGFARSSFVSCFLSAESWQGIGMPSPLKAVFVSIGRGNRDALVYEEASSLLRTTASVETRPRSASRRLSSASLRNDSFFRAGGR